ncbi:hypothetical protein N9N28_12980 [Rubripirellula amarantea]|nr:hypothetical protein [Rubripirellula amarantea]
MGDQATKLRQLVRSVRHAATIATGPPLLLVFAPTDSEIAAQVFQTLDEACGRRGIRIGSEAGTCIPSEAVDWTLAQTAGDYQIAEYELWHRASALLVATHDADESIVQCYQKLKVASQHTPLPPIELLVLGDGGEAEAQVAADRLSQTCQRFLLCSIAGTTLLDASTRLTVEAVETLMDRLAMMAPVATPVLNSPLANHDG